MNIANTGRASAAPPPPITPEGFTVELAKLASGDIRVALMATTIDEADLVFHEIATESVPSLDAALAMVKANVWFS